MRVVSPLNMDGSGNHRLNITTVFSFFTFLTGVCILGPRCTGGEVVVIECCDGWKLLRAHHGHGSHVQMFGHPEQARIERLFNEFDKETDVSKSFAP